MGEFGTVLLKDICNFEKGLTGLAKATPGKYPLVATGVDRRSCDSFQFDAKAVCIPLVSSTGHGHASLKNVHYQEGKFALGSILVALTAICNETLDIQFLHLYLSELKDKILVPLMSGAANVALSVTKIKNIEIPLPSITRQQEIVTQFKSIVAEEKELTAELTHQQTLLKKLRKQILQEAIEGKLTEQWRIDNLKLIIEPASELLKRIQAEKQQLVADGKIKKQKTLPPVSEEEKPFELPEGWVWCRLGDLINISSGDGLTANNMKDGQIPVFGGNGINGYHDSYNTDEVTVTIGRVGAYCGAIHLTPEYAWITDNCFRVYYSNVDTNYLIFHLRQMNLGKASFKGAQPVISGKRVYPISTQLPPLQEQKAIVTKVERLLALCDQLEAQITSNQTHAKQLMQAVLKEAFSQGDEPDELVA